MIKALLKDKIITNFKVMLMKKSLLTLLTIVILTGCTGDNVVQDKKVNSISSESEQRSEVIKVDPVVKDDINQFEYDEKIDTSQWKRCSVGATSFLCPPGWNSIERGVSNAPQNRQDAFLSGDVAVNFDGVALDFNEDPKLLPAEKESQITYLKERMDTCEVVKDTDSLLEVHCKKTTAHKFIMSISKIETQADFSNLLTSNLTTLSMSARNEQEYIDNKLMLNKVVESFR